MKLYHYTTGQKLELIRQSGGLEPSAKGGKPGEPPLLWFSSNPVFEMTSLKLISRLGELYALTREEQRLRAGNVRLVLSTTKPLMGWREACKYARISTKERKAMEASGIRAGANPRHWFATPYGIALESLLIEMENERGEWIKEALR